MGEPEGSSAALSLFGRLGLDHYFPVWKVYGPYGALAAILFTLVVPALLSLMFMGKKKMKQRGIPVQVGGEVGYALRNRRFGKLVEVPWKGAATMAALFEQSCKKHSCQRFLGSRKLISKEFVTASDGRKFEKLHLGDYNWITYGETFDRACNFASGLVRLGHNVDSRTAIFSESRAEWFIAFQV